MYTLCGNMRYAPFPVQLSGRRVVLVLDWQLADARITKELVHGRVATKLHAHDNIHLSCLERRPSTASKSNNLRIRIRNTDGDHAGLGTETWNSSSQSECVHIAVGRHHPRCFCSLIQVEASHMHAYSRQR